MVFGQDVVCSFLECNTASAAPLTRPGSQSVLLSLAKESDESEVLHGRSFANVLNAERADTHLKASSAQLRRGSALAWPINCDEYDAACAVARRAVQADVCVSLHSGSARRSMT